MNTELRLVVPSAEHKSKATAYRQEYVDCGEQSIHGSGGLYEAENYESWLQKITSAVTASQTGWVNCHTYFLFLHDRIIGTIQIRETLNDLLRKSGGNIGFGIVPSARNKGYGVQMLMLALEKCRQLHMKKVLITCDKGNIASEKTIIKGGGGLENTILENGCIVKRYWIDL